MLERRGYAKKCINMHFYSVTNTKVLVDQGGQPIPIFAHPPLKGFCQSGQPTLCVCLLKHQYRDLAFKISKLSTDFSSSLLTSENLLILKTTL